MVPPAFPPLDSGTCESWLWEKQHHMLDADLEHIHPSGKPYHSPVRFFHLVGTVNESSKGHSTILSIQVLQDGEHGKTTEFYKHGPIATLHLLGNEFLKQKQYSVEYHDGVQGIL